jgi:hypothetical protein
MRVPTRFTLFGYPGLAILGYLLASIAGFYLVLSTMMVDRKDRENAKLKGK